MIRPGVPELRHPQRHAGHHPVNRRAPDRIWVDEHGHDVALDRASEPQRWRAAVYSNHVIVTQFDDGDTVWPDVGYWPTSSCSMPSAVLGMLDALDVRAGMRVLEVGTGTGYNAALLAARLGDERVATVEVDPVLADQARSVLIAAGCTSTVICEDGAAGWRAGAPFDRIIVTAAVKFGRVPYSWVEQTTPGGIILTPLKTDFTAGPLVAFTVGRDGTATGRVVPLRVAFMEIRAQRTPVFSWDNLRWDDPDADLSHTDVTPWTTLGSCGHAHPVVIPVMAWRGWVTRCRDRGPASFPGIPKTDTRSASVGLVAYGMKWRPPTGGGWSRANQR